MHIEEVIIDGFKSYATRTVVSGWNPAFNAITGLNGSGKSNILDAICFVLGISNLSQVRAGSLQELVYKQGQAGVTKASVTIVFNNQDRKGSPVGYETYKQISVTRQVVIGGRNKYMINGHTAQLNQVQNLFHSVQLNVNNPHFLIMQGRITKVLNMKPPEILGMIEEAAGTRMYETKKQNAQKTMSKKQSKVDEINAVLSQEITPQLEKLRSEKTHYLKWSANSTDVERLERFCVAHEFSQHSAQLDKGQAEVDAMEAQVAELGATADGLQGEADAAAAEMEAAAEERDGPLAAAHAEAREAETAASKALVKASAAAENKQTAHAAEAAGRDAMRAAASETGASLEKKDAEIDAAAADAAVQAAASGAAKAALDAASEDHRNMSAGIASAGSDESATLETQIANAASAVSDANASMAQAAMKLKHLKASEKEATKALSKASNGGDKLASERAAVAKDLAALEKALSKVGYSEADEAALWADKEKAERAVTDLTAQAGELEARLEAKLRFAYSTPKGVAKASVKGMVAKLVKVTAPEACAALEVAAGGKLYQIVVDNERTAKALLENGKLKRRVTIVPLNKMRKGAGVNGERVARAKELAGSLGGTCRSALELVAYDDELKAAMEYAFGASLVCDSSGVARAVTYDSKIRCKTVTLEGDTFDPSGTLTGGAAKNLGAVLGGLQRLASLKEDLAGHSGALKAASGALDALRGAQKEFAKLEPKRDMAETRLGLLDAQLGNTEAAALQKTLDEVAAGLAAADASAAEAKASKAAAEAKAKALKAEAKSFKKRREEALAAGEKTVKAAKAAFAKAKDTAKAAERKAEGLKRERAAVEKEGTELAASLVAADAEVRKLSEEAAALSASAAERRAEYEAAEAALAVCAAALEAAGKALKALAKRKDAALEKKGDAELQAKKLAATAARFHKERAAAEAAVAAMLAKHAWIATEREFFGKAGTDFDFATQNPVHAGTKLKALRAEQEKLAKKINRKVMGMIEKAEAQYAELLGKRTTVEGDKLKIMRVIDELDVKKNETLAATWTKVNGDFGDIFSTLLPGAMSKLEPPEGLSVLDGLEVKVGFGQKWKESLTELSGGQRSLLALSLILALLRFKPCPMYILDEVDAALDLSHTQNIGTMLRKHFSNSQFIVVSLKEGMFSNANVIFRTKFVDGVSTVTRTVTARGEAEGAARNGAEEDEPVAAQASRAKRRPVARGRGKAGVEN